MRPLSRSCATKSTVYWPGDQRERPLEDQVAAFQARQLVERPFKRVVVAEALDDAAVLVADEPEEREPQAIRLLPAILLERHALERHLEDHHVVAAGGVRAELQRRRLVVEGMRRRVDGERGQQRHLERQQRRALARRQREVSRAALDRHTRARDSHLDLPELAVELLHDRRVCRLVIAADVGGHARHRRLEVVGVGDEEPAGALGQLVQRFLHVRAQALLGVLRDHHLIDADSAGPALGHLLLAGAGCLQQLVAAEVRVARGAQSASIDRVHGDVCPVRLADRRLEDLFEVLGNDQPLGEIQQGLAPARPPLCLHHAEQRIE